MRQSAPCTMEVGAYGTGHSLPHLDTVYVDDASTSLLSLSAARRSFNTHLTAFEQHCTHDCTRAGSRPKCLGVWPLPFAP